MYSMKQLVFVLNGGIAILENNFFIHRSNEQFLVELLEYFDKIIMPQIVVHSSEDSYSDWKVSDLSNVIIKDVNIFDSHKNLIHKTLNYMVASLKIINIVRSKRFFYLCIPGHVSMFFVISCFLFRKKYALYVRGDWLIGRHKILENFYDLMFRKACFIVVTGESHCDKIKQWNKNTEKVIPMIEFKSEDICHRCSYAFKNRINLIFLSRIEKAKGIFDALEVFERLHKKNSRIHLTVVGNGPDFVEFESLCETKGLTKSVFLLGLISNKDKLKKIYKSADIFIFPSYYREGFPRVLYEAMTFGLPIVTTFVGAIGSVMEDRLNCLRVKRQDSNDLEEKIWQLISDDKLREKIGKGATETMVRLFEKFERSSHAKQVIKLMERTGIYLN